MRALIVEAGNSQVAVARWRAESVTGGEETLERLGQESTPTSEAARVAWTAELRELVDKHFKLTGSTVARAALEDWDNALTEFVKVMPTDYKRVLAEMKKQEEQAVA